MSTVLVTGATGNVGSRVVQELLARGVTVRAFVRDPAKASLVIPEVSDVAVGDFEDPASIAKAFDGVERAFLTSANSPREVAHECLVVDAAAEARVRCLVKLSTVLARAGSPLPGMDWHGRIEDHLLDSGVPAAVLRSTWMMSNLLLSADVVRESGCLYAPAGAGRIAMIDPADVAAVAAVVLTEDGHAGRTYELTGPEALAYADVARTLTEVTGSSVAYVDVPEDAARQGMADAGMPDWLVTHIIGAFRLIRSGELAGTTDTVRVLTGREPRAFTEFVREHAHAFSP